MNKVDALLVSSIVCMLGGTTGAYLIRQPWYAFIVMQIIGICIVVTVFMFEPYLQS